MATKPYIGQLVHYMPPSLVVVPACPAFVANYISEETVALTVLSPKGVAYGIPKVGYDRKGGQNTWRYVEDEPQTGPMGVVRETPEEFSDPI